MLTEVTKDNYFTDTGHMSTSRFKRFLECEKLGMVGFGEPTEAMLVGSYVDAYVEGTLDEFIEENPSIMSSRGPTKGQLKAQFRKADEICEFIDNDSVLQDFLSGEKQVIMTGEIGGVPYKMMMDSYSPGIAINDLKVMARITDRSGEYYDFITQWRYDLQGAIYQEIVYQNTGERLPFYIVVVTKESPINSAVVQIDQNTLDNALYEVEYSSKRYYDILNNLEPTNGCGKCHVCISNRVETPIITLEELQRKDEFESF